MSYNSIDETGRVDNDRLNMTVFNKLAIFLGPSDVYSLEARVTEEYAVAKESIVREATPGLYVKPAYNLVKEVSVLGAGAKNSLKPSPKKLF